ncbi:class I mannose-6-phosphate isomerase [Sodalis sp. RH21]|uniref:class I mannose-6-phosphate isomerase n=1 Tax=unclassified Sodalis (in: enterobacteria) TaxID=2636512 RepID=UPI0039B64059
MPYLTHEANYEKDPSIEVASHAGKVYSGWREICGALAAAAAGGAGITLALDCYPGVDLAGLKRQLAEEHELLRAAQWLSMDECYQRDDALENRLADTLTADRVFGVMSCQTLDDYLLPDAVERLRRQQRGYDGLTCIIGTGAALAGRADILVYIDYPRWQRQLDWRAGGSNWLVHNPQEDFLKKYKRGFFWEWRVADRHKRTLFAQFDFYLDSLAQPAVMIDQAAFQAGLDACLARPFRLKPFFDPGVWGGKWMEEVCALPPTEKNYAWCFDGVPEENSLTLSYNGARITLPAINLVLARPVELLGEHNYARFGAEFPIRFDFLDTMEGGNLSLQVHPLTDYIQQHFGMHYTQDESYYLLDAGADASVYLGLKTGVRAAEMVAAIEQAQRTGQLDALQYVNNFPVKKHDHILIPAGTIHCSGSNAMILEISATPYIFTFKLWDWGRLGLDNQPRPVHLAHGRQVIQADRDTQWCREQLINRIDVKEDNADFTCERTGLHELEFIDTHRYWIKTAVTLETRGEFQMLNLIEGQEAIVDCPDNCFAPYTLHYAETLIIPGSVRRYRVSGIAGQGATGIIVANVRQQEATR